MLRTRTSLKVFPVTFTCAMSLFHFYYLSFPLGFTHLALIAFASVVQVCPCACAHLCGIYQWTSECPCAYCFCHFNAVTRCFVSSARARPQCCAFMLFVRHELPALQSGRISAARPREILLGAIAAPGGTAFVRVETLLACDMWFLLVAVFGPTGLLRMRVCALTSIGIPHPCQ
jgi:hypothetical protein